MEIETIGRMPAYGVEHVTMLLVSIVATLAVVVFVRGRRDFTAVCRMATGFGWLLLVISVAWTLWGMTPTQWNINESLPFHFSDALRLITAIALITRSGWSVAVSYYWGLTLNTQSLLTPNLNYFSYPVVEFAMYWFLHIAVLVAPALLVWGLGYRPSWKGFGWAYLITVGWAALTLGVNAMTGANYGFLSHAPPGTSVLDVLGPWPIYLLSEAMLVALVWALMTWPWNLSGAGEATVATDWTGATRRRAHAADTDVHNDVAAG